MGRYDQKTPRFTPGQKKTRIRVFIGSVIFYLFLAGYIYVFLQAANYGYGLLMDWLGKLEASQPGVRSQEVFEELFSDPDWEELYRMAGEQDTVYEGADEYAAYMEAKVGDQKLTYVQTSAGLSKNKKYIVKLGKARIAEFTMANDASNDADMPQWRLDEVFVYYTRQESLTIFTVPGHTVCINDIAIDTEEHLIAYTSTVAEEYLPDNLHGYRDITLSFGGLLVQPEVTILDENGTPMEVAYDPETNHYSEILPKPEDISEEMSNLVINASKAYGRYMINEKDHNLKAYYDANEKAYQDITQFTDRWTVQKNKGYSFEDIVVKDYYRYSDSYFSVRVSMALNVIRTDSTNKYFTMDTTFFVHQNAQGVWLVENMTNVDVQVASTMVKLQFMNGNHEVQTQWVNANAKQITLPELEIPEGKEFLGWYTKTVDGLNISYTPVFNPSETGIVYLPDEYELQPMVLYAQFGKEGSWTS